MEDLQFQRNLWEFDGNLSTGQMLLLTTADVGECKQLAQAIADLKASKTCKISNNLQNTCLDLNAAEDALVIWQCLLDAVLAHNRSEIVFWMDQALELKLDLPEGLADVYSEESSATCNQDSNCEDSASTASPSRSCKSVRELLEECQRRGISTRGSSERADLEKLLRDAPQPDPAEARRFKIQVPASTVAREAKSCDAGTVWERYRASKNQGYGMRGQHLHLLGLGNKLSVPLPELKNAYRKAAMECHPDRQQNHDREEDAKALFQKVREAFDYLRVEQGGR
jgi:hypothetical protein